MVLTLCDVVITNDRRHVGSFVKMPGYATCDVGGENKLSRSWSTWAAPRLVREAREAGRPCDATCDIGRGGHERASSFSCAAGCRTIRTRLSERELRGSFARPSGFAGEMLAMAN